MLTILNLDRLQVHCKWEISANEDKKTVRTTVTIPVGDYEELEQIAERKKVSVAWVVRDAIENYLNREMHLVQDEARG